MFALAALAALAPGSARAAVHAREARRQQAAPPAAGRYVREIIARGGARGKGHDWLILNPDFTVHRVVDARPGSDPAVEFGRWGVRGAGIAVTLSHRDGARLPEPERMVFAAHSPDAADGRLRATAPGGGTAALVYYRALAPEVGERVEALVTHASDGDEARVAESLGAGVPIDAKNERGWTPLIAAARSGEGDIVRFLARKGANPNAASPSGYTPLMAAVEFGDAAIVSYLLSRQANPNAAASGGGTALMIAAANKFGDEENNLAIARTLVRAGANVRAAAKPTGGSGGAVTALSLATERKARRIAAYLRSVGAK